MSTSTEAIVNGEPFALSPDESVADLVAARCGGSTRGIAVARNGEVVPRSMWNSEKLVAGDRIEILTAAAGG